jgi:hypothetical protein
VSACIIYRLLTNRTSNNNGCIIIITGREANSDRYEPVSSINTVVPNLRPKNSLHPIMAHVVITGLKTGIPLNPQASEYPERLEWNTFARSHYNVTLFAKALQIMESMSQDISVPLSFFQIAGIALDTLKLY